MFKLALILAVLPAVILGGRISFTQCKCQHVGYIEWLPRSNLHIYLIPPMQATVVVPCPTGLRLKDATRASALLSTVPRSPCLLSSLSWPPPTHWRPALPLPGWSSIKTWNYPSTLSTVATRSRGAALWRSEALRLWRTPSSWPRAFPTSAPPLSSPWPTRPASSPFASARVFVWSAVK